MPRYSGSTPGRNDPSGSAVRLVNARRPSSTSVLVGTGFDLEEAAPGNAVARKRKNARRWLYFFMVRGYHVPRCFASSNYLHNHRVAAFARMRVDRKST